MGEEVRDNKQQIKEIMEAKPTKVTKDIKESVKGPSFTLMYMLLLVIVFASSVAFYSISRLEALEKSHQQDITNIKSALTCIETLPNRLYGADGKKSELNVTIEYPKVFTNQEDYLGTIIPIIQEQNAQAYDSLSNSLTLFSILIALIALALPIFSYAFIQKDQMKSINLQHNKLVNEVENGFQILEDKNKKLENDVSNAIAVLRKEILQAQEVTSKNIPDIDVNSEVSIQSTSDSKEDRARALYLGAKINLNKQNYKVALNQISEAIELSSQNAEYYYIRARINYKIRNFSQALIDADQAIKIDSGNALFYNIRGCIYNSIYDRKKALADMRTAVTLDPTSVVLIVSLATALVNMRQYHEAFETLNTVAEKDRNDEIFLTSLCWIYYRNGRFEDALEICNTHDKELTGYLKFRTKAMSILKLTIKNNEQITDKLQEEILSDLDRAINEEKEAECEMYSLLYKAEASLILKQHSLAFEAIESALKKLPDCPEGYHWLAEYYRAIGDVEKAALNDRIANEKGYIPEPEE